MLDYAIPLVTFLAGTLTGAAGQYLAAKFTDKRHKIESLDEESHRFATIAAQMPQLLREIKGDLERDGQELTRHFFVLASPALSFCGSRDAHFIYYENTHAALRDKVAALGRAGYVRDITPGNAPKYVMSDAFVTRLRAWRPPAPLTHGSKSEGPL